MNNDLVRFSPAECSENCHDRNCPYIHVSGWRVAGAEGLFSTERAARDYLKLLLPEQPSSFPREICLTRAEMQDLVSLTVREQSAMDFWKRAFLARGISCPQERVCAMVYMAPDKFRLEWHSKALGPEAIAAGRDYRAFAERKDREFAARASR